MTWDELTPEQRVKVESVATDIAAARYGHPFYWRDVADEILRAAAPVARSANAAFSEAMFRAMRR